VTDTGDEVMVRVPGRVNLIGDHTDYTGGLALPMAIDRWTVLTGRRSGHRIELTSDAETGTVDLSLPLAIEPSSVEPAWGRFVAGVVAEMAPPMGLQGRLDTTIPVGAGLSSSAALGLAVALALGFDGSALELAQLCRRAEHRATGVPTGIMDQLCIASTQPGHATLLDCHTLGVTQVPVPPEARIAVIFVAHRTLDGSPYADRVAQCAAAEAIIGPLRLATPHDVDRLDDALLRRRARHVVAENARVRRFAQALHAGDLTAAGREMRASHDSLRHDYEVSTPQIDAVVEHLHTVPGVYGARLTGGGFGGCVVALCAPGLDLPGAWWVHPVGAAACSASRHGDPT
jgi:galactokinase